MTEDTRTKIRHTTIDDCHDIFDWRVDEESLRASFSRNKPDYTEHRSWFENSLSNPSRVMLLGEIDSRKIGVCRFDISENQLLAEVSINMNPKCRGQGFGKNFLKESIAYYLAEKRCDLLARVKPTNIASLKIFESAGFETISSTIDMVVLKKS